jgi:hypothetical protein
LGQIGLPKGIRALQKRLRIESDPTVKMEIEDALTEAKKPHKMETHSEALSVR